jgi:ribosomal protein L36
MKIKQSVPKRRNIKFIREDNYPPMKIEPSVPKRRHIKFRTQGITQRKHITYRTRRKFEIKNKFFIFRQNNLTLEVHKPRAPEKSGYKAFRGGT